MPVDEEGGKVIRLNTGTRMTGNMAIGATTDATANAELTGRILGEELAAIGFNIDFAPVIDVNNNPSNPVIGTRSFSDDPETVASLGAAYSKGLAENNMRAQRRRNAAVQRSCTENLRHHQRNALLFP